MFAMFLASALLLLLRITSSLAASQVPLILDEITTSIDSYDQTTHLQDINLDYVIIATENVSDSAVESPNLSYDAENELFQESTVEYTTIDEISTTIQLVDQELSTDSYTTFDGNDPPLLNVMDHLDPTDNSSLKEEEDIEIFPLMTKKCTSRTCLRKCCLEFQILRVTDSGMKCLDSNDFNSTWKIPAFKTKFGKNTEPLGQIEIIPGGLTCELYGFTIPDEPHHLLPNGNLFNEALKEEYGQKDYCMEVFHEYESKKLQTIIRNCN